jgi:hypothetical protein
MSEFIRAIRHPVIFDSRTLHVTLVTLRSHIGWRKLAWSIRRHPEIWLRARHLELVRPGHALIDFHDELEDAT